MKKSALAALLHSKVGKLIPILLITAMMTTASASVFTYYYGNTTATVRASDMQLIAGADNLGGSTYPTATVTVSSTNDFATMGISLFKSATNTPQPATYFTDLLEVKNNAGSASHTVKLVSISGITATRGADFGSITVYYCASQTDNPAGSNLGSFAITSTTGGNVFSGTDTITAGTTHYIEIVAYAGTGATTGDTITFTVNIQWE